MYRRLTHIQQCPISLLSVIPNGSEPWTTSSMFVQSRLGKTGNLSAAIVPPVHSGANASSSVSVQDVGISLVVVITFCAMTYCIGE